MSKFKTQSLSDEEKFVQNLTKAENAVSWSRAPKDQFKESAHSDRAFFQ